MPDQKIKITIPATSANLGPGFDSLGMALSLHNVVILSKGEHSHTTFEISGIDAFKIPQDNRNLVYCAAQYLFKKVGKQAFPFHIHQHNNIPVSSGLGSSSTAVLGGLIGANGLLDFPLSQDEILDLAIEIEGHPDNVAPAMHGGLILSVMHEQGTHIEKIDLSPLNAVVVLPDFHLLTSEARAALPTHISRADAIFNSSRLALLVQAFQKADFDLLSLAMQDRLHQPYRLNMIPGAQTAVDAAYLGGAKGVALSGAGPSLIAFGPDNLPQIGNAMRQAFQEANLSSRQWLLKMDTTGIQTAKI